MSEQTPAQQRSEEDREAAGIAPEKWSVMSREERRAAGRAARSPRDRQIRQPRRDR